VDTELSIEGIDWYSTFFRDALHINIKPALLGYALNSIQAMGGSTSAPAPSSIAARAFRSGTGAAA
jgi:hypothetical protein